VIGAPCPDRNATPTSEDEGSRRYATRPQLAVAALMYMLSRYPATRKPALAHAIVDHLRMVADDPRLDPALRECASGLIGDWQAFALLGDEDVPLPRRLPS